MQYELAGSILFARDMEKMARFYRDVLGLEPVPSDYPPEEFLPLCAGAAIVSLHEIPSPYRDGIEIADPPEPRSGTPIKLVFRVDDVLKAREDLIGRGVQMRQPFMEGSRCDGIDPEGNVFQLTSS